MDDVATQEPPHACMHACTSRTTSHRHSHACMNACGGPQTSTAGTGEPVDKRRVHVCKHAHLRPHMRPGTLAVWQSCWDWPNSRPIQTWRIALSPDRSNTGLRLTRTARPASAGCSGLQGPWVSGHGGSRMRQVPRGRRTRRTAGSARGHTLGLCTGTYSQTSGQVLRQASTVG